MVKEDGLQTEVHGLPRQNKGQRQRQGQGFSVFRRPVFFYDKSRQFEINDIFEAFLYKFLV